MALVQRAEALWQHVDVVDDHAVVEVGQSSVEDQEGRVEERGAVEEGRCRLLRDDDAERSTLELQLRNDVAKPDVEVRGAIAKRHDDGDGLRGPTLARRPTAVFQLRTFCQWLVPEVWVVLADGRTVETRVHVEPTDRSQVVIPVLKQMLETVCFEKVDREERWLALQVKRSVMLPSRYVHLRHPSIHSFARDCFQCVGVLLKLRHEMHSLCWSQIGMIQNEKANADKCCQ